MIGRRVGRAMGCLGSLGLNVAGVATMAWPQPAFASDWGCRVVLCLATPGSPTTYSECVPPITKLWHILAIGGSFPDCSEGGVGTDTSRFRNGYRLHMVLPNGARSDFTINTKTQTITPR